MIAAIAVALTTINEPSQICWNENYVSSNGFTVVATPSRMPQTMPRRGFAVSSLLSILQEAAVSPEAWPEVLKVLTDATGVAGAALIISNKRTGQVDDACFSGLSAEFKSEYVRHYAAVDPYSPLLDGNWMKLSDCLPDPMLRRSEWYNDFVLTCGVRDILGVRLVDTASHCAIFGIHQEIGRSFPGQLDAVVDLVNVPLKHAAWRHIDRLFATRPAVVDDGSQASLVETSRFYFHVDNGSRYPDETGSLFPTPADAAEHAVAIAKELAQDASWHGFTVLVTDSHGQEIAGVPIEPPW